MVKYYLNGNLWLPNNGIHVRGAKGFLSLPERKVWKGHSYDDENGVRADIIHGSWHVKERKLKLSCFTERMLHAEMFTRVNNLLGNTMDAGLAVLELRHHLYNTVLPYTVYATGRVEPKITYCGNLSMCTFDLEFCDPCPVKRVYLANITAPDRGASVEIGGHGSLSEGLRWNVYWGDGRVTADVAQGAPCLHTYTRDGKFAVLITGEVVQLGAVTATAAGAPMPLLWDILM